VLRITNIGTNGARTLKVEGRLAAEWVPELSRAVADVLKDDSRVALNLGGITSLDQSGVVLLRALRAQGCELLECSTFVSSVLDGGSE